MPYIKQDKRQILDPHLEKLSCEVTAEGELNYCIYKLSCLIVDKMGESYDVYSMCSSAMEHAKLEWYRKRVAPYEDKKITENGDI